MVLIRKSLKFTHWDNESSPKFLHGKDIKGNTVTIDISDIRSINVLMYRIREDVIKTKPRENFPGAQKLTDDEYREFDKKVNDMK